ncbi:TetR/AcrR family transcriptional regulator [Actinoplanes derwentensis]|uniref:DNA-binding transcriptional regulator, AcrR family n=1 Tax=Actinoplanes derwentensis TaxID=113562 RepID=A0A1H2B7F0_9ACTN|nr:TetR/AcrR family transcriptional regulator [Actinoplanes derwentensis]GID86437.1 TetR family transcriptional regulator [Actinoplanes derwentensis]SDT54220.1 DNA-binding transcriptional regulator, AcrR family [Actinoplanes derwentensis]
MPRTTAKALDSRQRFIDVALGLFTRHSFAGTSLQMIAAELGVTKSAVHHHFRSREDLLLAVIEPLAGQLRAAVEAAEAIRGHHARAERLLIGFVDIVVHHKSLMSLLSGDPGVIEMLRAHPELSALSQRQMALFAGVEAGPAGEVKASVVTRGLAGAAANPALGLDDRELHAHLCAVGRLTLGLPKPRPTTAENPL